ncbi:hypothetical protein Rcae01_02314 [Novipirellula caenicola]|uniref:Tetratricopeptide repeat protein n=2 Tax=Novipirellula caenicola TaxID=1536901 RepID=A0ABP9VPZ0_9BACT
MNVIKTYLPIMLIAAVVNTIAFADEAVPSDAQRYNEAVQQYAAGETERASETLLQLSGSDHDEIAARSRYNLGNIRYVEALKQLEQEGNDGIKVVGLLQEAIKHYRGALAIHAADQDARANIELAMQLISQIQQQQQQQQQQQAEQPQSQQQNEKQKSQQDPQQQTESESKQSESKQESSESNDSDSQDESKSEKSETQQSKQAGQEGESESNSEAQPNQDENQGPAENNPSQSDADDGPSETSESANSDPSQSGDSQSMPPDADSGADNPPENPAPDQSSPHQPQNNVASDDNRDADPSDAEPQPTEAAESDPSKTEGELSAVNGQNENDAASEDDPQKPTAIGVMTKDEAQKMLQAIRDREMLRRMQTEREQRRRQVPVDKDW